MVRCSGLSYIYESGKATVVALRSEKVNAAIKRLQHFFIEKFGVSQTNSNFMGLFELFFHLLLTQ